MRKTQCNSARRRLDSRAYTMAEMLLVVGLLAILLAVGAVGASQMMRQGRQASLDKMAETLYIAVQRNLTAAELSGTTIPPITTANEGEEWVVRYVRQKPVFIEGGGFKRIPNTMRVYKLWRKGSPSDQEEELERILLQSVSEELVNSNWIIKFDPSDYSVLDVYFSQTEARQTAFFTSVADDEGELKNLTDYDNRIKSDALIGYYQGDGKSSLALPEPPQAPPPASTTSGDPNFDQETGSPNSDIVPGMSLPEYDTGNTDGSSNTSGDDIGGGGGGNGGNTTTNSGDNIPAPVNLRPTTPTTQDPSTTDGNGGGNNEDPNSTGNDEDPSNTGGTGGTDQSDPNNPNNPGGDTDPERTKTPDDPDSAPKPGGGGGTDPGTNTDPNPGNTGSDGGNSPTLLTPDDTTTRQTEENNPLEEENITQKLYCWIGYDDNYKAPIANTEKLVTRLNCWVPKGSAFDDRTGPVNVNFTLLVRGVSSTKTKTFYYRMDPFGFYSARNGNKVYTDFVSGKVCQSGTRTVEDGSTVDGWYYSYLVVLDSLIEDVQTGGKSLTLDQNQRFKNRFSTSDGNQGAFIPGEDLMLRFEVDVADNTKERVFDSLADSLTPEEKAAKAYPDNPATLSTTEKVTWLNGHTELWKVHMPGWNEYPMSNSLFADTYDANGKREYASPVVQNAVGGGYSYVAKIAYGRHLQNLDSDISGIGTNLSEIKSYYDTSKGADSIRALQIADIDFQGTQDIARYKRWDFENAYGGDYRNNNQPYTFTPINNINLIKYNGNEQTIKNLQINVTDGSGINKDYNGAQNGVGLFGALSGNVTLSNLKLENPVIVADRAGINVGAFAGKAVGNGTLTLEGLTLDTPQIRAQNQDPEQDPEKEDQAAANVGGIIGQATEAVSATGGLRLENLSLKDTKADTIGGVIGLAGTGSSVTLSGVEMVNPKLVGGTSTAVGGLVGKSEAPVADGNQVTISSGQLYMTDYADKKLDNVLDKWLVGGQYAGGLIGYAEGNVTINKATDGVPSFAATVVNANAEGDASKQTYAGGLAGYVNGKLTVDSAWADCYVKAKGTGYIGGLAGHCGAGSEFTHCYAAGFVVSNTRTFGDDIMNIENAVERQTRIAQELNKDANKQPLTVAGFAPCEVGSISDAYSVFNYDDPTIGITGIVPGAAENVPKKGQPAVLKLAKKYKLAAAAGTVSEAYYAYGGEALIDGVGTSIDRDTLKLKQIPGFVPNEENKTSNGIDKDKTKLYTLFDDELERDGVEPNETPDMARYPYPVLSVAVPEGQTLTHYNDFLVTNPKKLISVTIDRSREAALKALISSASVSTGDTVQQNQVANYLSHSTNAEPQSGDVDEYPVGSNRHIVPTTTPSRRANGERFVGWFTEEEFLKYKFSLLKSSLAKTYVTFLNQSDIPTPADANAKIYEAANEGEKDTPLLGNQARLIFPKKDGNETRTLYAVYEHLDPFLVTVENRYYNENRMNAALVGIIIEACKENSASPLKDIALTFYEVNSAGEYQYEGGTRKTVSLSYASATEKSRLYNFKAKYLTDSYNEKGHSILEQDFAGKDTLMGILNSPGTSSVNWSAEIEPDVTLNDLMKEAFAGSHLSQPQSIPVDTTAPEYTGEPKNHTFTPFSVDVLTNADENKKAQLATSTASYCARFDTDGTFLGFVALTPAPTPATYNDVYTSYAASHHKILFKQTRIDQSKPSRYVALYTDIDFQLSVDLEFRNTEGNAPQGSENDIIPDPAHLERQVWDNPAQLKEALYAAQTALNGNATASVSITGSLGTTVLNKLDQLTFEGFTLNEKDTKSSIILARAENQTKVYYDRNKNTLSYDFAGGVYKGTENGPTQSFRASNSYYQTPTGGGTVTTSEGQDSGGVFYGQVLSDHAVSVDNVDATRTYLPKETGTENVVSKNGYDFNGWEFYASKDYDPDVTLTVNETKDERGENKNGWFATIPAMGLDYKYMTVDGVDGVEFLQDPATGERVTVQYEDDPDGDGTSSPASTYYVMRNKDTSTTADYFMVCDNNGNPVTAIDGSTVTIAPDDTLKTWKQAAVSTDVFFTGGGDYIAFDVVDGYLCPKGTREPFTVRLNASLSAEGNFGEVLLNETPVYCHIKVSDYGTDNPTYYYVYADTTGTHEEFGLEKKEIKANIENFELPNGFYRSDTGFNDYLKDKIVTLENMPFDAADLTIKSEQPNDKNGGKLYYATVTSGDDITITKDFGTCNVSFSCEYGIFYPHFTNVEVQVDEQSIKAPSFVVQRADDQIIPVVQTNVSPFPVVDEDEDNPSQSVDIAQEIARRAGHYIGKIDLHPTGTLLTRALSSYRTSVPMPENKRALQDSKGYLLDGIGNVNQSTRALTPGSPILFAGDTPSYLSKSETVTWTDAGGTEHTAPKITWDYASLYFDNLSEISVYRAVLHYDGTKEWVATTLDKVLVTLDKLKMPDFDVTAKALWQRKVSTKVRLEIYIQRQTDDWRMNTSRETWNDASFRADTDRPITGVKLGKDAVNETAYNNSSRHRLYDFYQVYDIGEQKTADYMPGGTYESMINERQYQTLLNTFFNMVLLRDSGFNNANKDYLYGNQPMQKRGMVKCTQLYLNPGASGVDTSTGDIVYRIYLDRNVVSFRWQYGDTTKQIYGLYEEPLNNPVTGTNRTFDTTYVWWVWMLNNARNNKTGNRSDTRLTMLGSFAYVGWDTNKESYPGLFLGLYKNDTRVANNQRLIYWKEAGNNDRDTKLRDLALGILPGYDNFAAVPSKTVNKLVEQDMLYNNTGSKYSMKSNAISYWTSDGTKTLDKSNNSIEGRLGTAYTRSSSFYINDKLSGYHFVALEKFAGQNSNAINQTVEPAIFDTSKVEDTNPSRYTYTGQALLSGLTQGLTLYNARNWHTITFSDIEYGDNKQYDKLQDAYFYGATLTRLPDIGSDEDKYRPARYGNEYEFGGWFTGRDGSGTQLKFDDPQPLALGKQPQQNGVEHNWLTGSGSGYTMGDADVTVFAYWKRKEVSVSFDINYPVSEYDLTTGQTYHEGKAYAVTGADVPSNKQLSEAMRTLSGNDRYDVNPLNDSNPSVLEVDMGGTFQEALKALHPNATTVAMPAPEASANGIYGDHSGDIDDNDPKTKEKLQQNSTAKVKYVENALNTDGNPVRTLYVDRNGEFFYVYYKFVGWYTFDPPSDKPNLPPTQENLEQYGTPVGVNDVVMGKSYRDENDVERWRQTLYGKWQPIAGKTDYYVECYLDTQDGETEDIVKIHLYKNIGDTGTMSPPLPEKADSETDPVIAAQYRRLEGYYPVSDLIPYEITPGYEFKFHYVKGDRWQYRIRENVTFKNADGTSLTFPDGSTLTLVTRNATAATMSAQIQLSANLNGYRLTGYRTNDVTVDNVTLYRKIEDNKFEVYSYTPGQIAANAARGEALPVPVEPPTVSRPNNVNPEPVEENHFEFQGSDGVTIAGKRVTATETGKVIDFDYEIRYDEVPTVADVAYMTGGKDDYLTPLRRGSGIPTPVAAYVGDDFYYTSLTLTYTHKDEGGTDYTVTQGATYDTNKGLSVPGEVKLKVNGAEVSGPITAGTYSVRAELALWKDGTTPALGTWTSPLPDATVTVVN